MLLSKFRGRGAPVFAERLRKMGGGAETDPQRNVCDGITGLQHELACPLHTLLQHELMGRQTACGFEAAGKVIGLNCTSAARTAMGRGCSMFSITSACTRFNCLADKSAVLDGPLRGAR